MNIQNIYTYKDGNLYRIKASGGQKEGSVAGWITTCNGKKYKKININRKTFYLHQIIFLYHHGYIPKYIDHKDGDSLNNYIENLREATQSQNVHNSPKRSTNTSGFKGVVWIKVRSKWRAQICVNGKSKNLGEFANINDAAFAYEQGTVKFFGEFAKSTNRLVNRSHE